MNEFNFTTGKFKLKLSNYNDNQHSITITIYYNFMVDASIELFMNKYTFNYTFDRNLIYLTLQKKTNEKWIDILIETNVVFIQSFGKKYIINNVKYNNYIIVLLNNNLLYDTRLQTRYKCHFIKNDYFFNIYIPKGRFEFKILNKCKRISYTIKNTNIPNYIYQTWKNVEIQNNSDDIQSIINNNKSFSYKLYNDEMCIKFIKENFDDNLINTYLQLNNQVTRADLWRYCILYKYGGVYIDIDCNCQESFGNLLNNYMVIPMISLTNRSTLNKVLNKSKVFQGFIMTAAGNPILYKCIQQIVSNVNNYLYKYEVLRLTGTDLFYDIYKNFTYNVNLPIKTGKYNNINGYIHFDDKLYIKSQLDVPDKPKGVGTSYMNDNNIYQNKIHGKNNCFDIQLNITTSNINLVLSHELNDDYFIKYDINLYDVTTIYKTNKNIIIYIKHIFNRTLDCKLQIIDQKI